MGTATDIHTSRRTRRGGGSRYDFDWLVVGSGSGGSVSALRLSEKGYAVGVLECGRRFADDEFAASMWDFRRYYWVPKLRMKGNFLLTLFKDVFVVSGCGVGEGSLGYGNTLYVPPSEFFRDRQWSALEDWESVLAPHYAAAQRMLGVVDYDRDDLPGRLLRELGVANTYRRTRVGVCLGDPGRTVSDAYFGGQGPPRTGCTRCGPCMVGCSHGAKNTLVKNYLWFAERRGARMMPERTGLDIRPLGAADGSAGYAVTSKHSGAWWAKIARPSRRAGSSWPPERSGRTGCSRAAGFAAHFRLRGSLPAISNRLGELVRTNSEAIVLVMAKDPQATSATASRSARASTRIRAHISRRSRTAKAGDANALGYTLLTGDGTRVTRPLRWLAGIVRHPVEFARTLSPRGSSRRSIMLLVMQTHDNAIALRALARRWGGGVPQSSVTEALFTALAEQAMSHVPPATAPRTAAASNTTPTEVTS